MYKRNCNVFSQCNRIFTLGKRITRTIKIMEAQTQYHKNFETKQNVGRQRMPLKLH